jgi:hypothetical protein
MQAENCKGNFLHALGGMEHPGGASEYLRRCLSRPCAKPSNWQRRSFAEEGPTHRSRVQSVRRVQSTARPTVRGVEHRSRGRQAPQAGPGVDLPGGAWEQSSTRTHQVLLTYSARPVLPDVTETQRNPSPRNPEENTALQGLWCCLSSSPRVYSSLPTQLFPPSVMQQPKNNLLFLKLIQAVLWMQGFLLRWPEYGLTSMVRGGLASPCGLGIYLLLGGGVGGLLFI